ncbi:MAG: RHS repeat-associated core domain-containing protein [Bacteroidota bacterium]
MYRKMRGTIRMCVFCLVLLPLFSIAQQPFEKYGKEVPIATMSNGKFEEFFDQDTLVQIGTVILNRLSGELYGFVKYDTLHSEATLDPQVISRWLSPDPLADHREWVNPYNFVQNNPILRIDPDGMLDDYYDSYGNYLGNDGQGDAIRLVREGQETTVASLLQGEQTTGANRSAARSSGNSALITIDPGIQDVVQGVADKSLSSGIEHQALILLDIYSDNPTITAKEGPSGTNSKTTILSVPDGGKSFDRATGFLILGQIHGHPKTNEEGTVNIPGVSPDYDIPTSQKLKIPIYAIDAYIGNVGDSQNIHRANPNSTRRRDNQTKNVGKTGSFNIARDAIEIHGRKRDQ